MQHILDRARNFTHPTRSVKLYEDTDYNSAASCTQKRKDFQQVEVEVVEKNKNTKVRVKKELNENAENAGKDIRQKELTDKARKKFTKKSAAVDALSASFKVSLEKAEEDTNKA